jgi:hypothetical protein
MDKLPDHLGGHMNKVHVDGGAIALYAKSFRC